MSFNSKLEQSIRQNNSLLCVGMDPQEEMLPAGNSIGERLVAWGTHIIDLTADLVCCYKPNVAFYEQYGPEGLIALQKIIAHIPSSMPVLLDAKRGDIGSTASAYATAVYDQLKADAVTLSPYLGSDSIKPFIKDPEKTVFILCQTSNPSANEIQGHGIPPLFEHIAHTASSWGNSDQIGFVVGATQPEALQKVRQICSQNWILAPGVGAQGADLQTALTAGLRRDGKGLIIPVSRGVLLAPDPREQCIALRNSINAVRDTIQTGQAIPAQEHLIIGLFEAGCVKFGNFTLASGKASPIYIDLRRLVSFPGLFSDVAQAYAEKASQLSFDLISGVPYAALPISAVVALMLGKGLLYARKEAKTHGTGQTIEGVFSERQTVILLEDVVTSGGSIITTADTLRQANLNLKDVIVLVERPQGGRESLAAMGIDLHAILSLNDILNTLKNRQLIDNETFINVKEYLEG